MLPPTHFPVHPLNHEVQFSLMLNFNRRNHAEPSFCRGRHLSCKIICCFHFRESKKYMYIYRGLTLSGLFKTEPPAVECAVVACNMQMIMISGGFHVCMLLKFQHFLASNAKPSGPCQQFLVFPLPQKQSKHAD